MVPLQMAGLDLGRRLAVATNTCEKAGIGAHILVSDSHRQNSQDIVWLNHDGVT